jgi:hypothetical protein
MRYRVVQWATGAIGKQCLRMILRDPHCELVGLYCYSPEKDGMDAGEIIGQAGTGVLATRDREAILGLDADVVVNASMLNPETWDQLDRDAVDTLRAGKNLISTGAYFSPGADGDDYVRMLEKACEAGGTTLYGTGMNPGFLFDRLGPTLSAMCGRVDRISFVQVDDLSKHPSWLMIHDQVYFGRDPD